jgi:ATP-dependent helicase HrpA
LLNGDISYPLRKADFERLVQNAKEQLPGVVPKLVELISNILRLRQELLLVKKRPPELQRELQELIPTDFLERIPAEQLQHVPRYLKAMLVRAERWSVNPLKDQEKSGQILPFVQRSKTLAARKDLSTEQSRAVEKLRWLIEELKVSLYANSLKKTEFNSSKRQAFHS